MPGSPSCENGDWSPSDRNEAGQHHREAIGQGGPRDDAHAALHPADFEAKHIHPRYSLGNVFETGWDDLLDTYWGSPQHRRFQTLCRFIYQDLIVDGEMLVFCWDELIASASARDPETLPRHEHIWHPHDHTPEIEEARRRGA